MKGFIKLHRRIIDWWWYKDNNVKCVFLHLLLNASFKDFEWQGEKFSAGQLITTRKKLADELGLSENIIRSSLERLLKTGEIHLKTTRKFTVINIVKWRVYQGLEQDGSPKLHPKTTQKSPDIKKKENINISPSISPPKKRGRKREIKIEASYDLELVEKILTEKGKV